MTAAVKSTYAIAIQSELVLLYRSAVEVSGFSE